MQRRGGGVLFKRSRLKTRLSTTGRAEASGEPSGPVEAASRKRRLSSRHARAFRHEPRRCPNSGNASARGGGRVSADRRRRFGGGLLRRFGRRDGTEYHPLPPGQDGRLMRVWDFEWFTAGLTRSTFTIRFAPTPKHPDSDKLKMCVVKAIIFRFV